VRGGGFKVSSTSHLHPLPGHAARTPAGGLPVPREAADQDRRRRILAATAELVAKRGYHATTLDLIVRRARIGYPAFYKSFCDKEAAFLALFDKAAARVERLMHEAVASCADRPWPESAATVLRALFTEIASQPIVARACLVEVLTAGAAAVSRYEAALREMRPVLLPGRNFNPRAEELSDTLEDTLASGVAWIVYQRLVAGEAERLPELLPEALEFVLLPYLGEAETARAVERLG
jgi:AcrR family transcriptional regulator